jgi:hypothetical protein
VPEGVTLLGDGTVSDMLWSRPALTVLGIDCPPVVGSAAAARLNLQPQCLIHTPNESVDPSEIERMALAEALFLTGYPAGRGHG